MGTTIHSFPYVSQHMEKKNIQPTCFANPKQLQHNYHRLSGFLNGHCGLGHRYAKWRLVKGQNKAIGQVKFLFFLGYKGKIKALCFTELANNHDGQSDFSYDYVPNQYWQAESAIHELKALSR